MNSIAQPPKLLSMEISYRHESEYRLLIGDRIKYLSIAARTLPTDTLRFLPSLLDALPPLKSHKDWTIAYISRNSQSGELTTVFSEQNLAGVLGIWHPRTIDCLRLKRVKQITGATFEASLVEPDPSLLLSTFIVKIARFEWEITRLERETYAYTLLEGSGLAPKFLGHVAENGRVIGFILEKAIGCEASIKDLAICEAAVSKLHSLGLMHGDLNRFNFIVGKCGVKLIDFENAKVSNNMKLMQCEIEGLANQLT